MAYQPPARDHVFLLRDVLEIDRDHDPFAAIERGEDAEPAAVEWFLHRLEGTSPDHGLAA